MPSRPGGAVRGMPASTRILRLLVLLGVVVAAGFFFAAVFIRETPTYDARSYWEAALRLQNGDPLYRLPPGDVRYNAYLYAPWFAAAWVPLTWLDKQTVMTVWVAFLTGMTLLAVWPLVRAGPTGLAVGLLLAAFLFQGAYAGHVQPLMVAMLVWLLPTRIGPLALGIAASLKIVPIVMVVRYVARRQWYAAAASIGIAGALWSPALVLGMDSWGIPVEETMSLLGWSPVAWAALVVVSGALALRVAGTSHGWWAAGLFWTAALPRILVYDLGSVAVGAADLRLASSSGDPNKR